MKRTHLFGTILVAALGVSVVAQSQTLPQNEQTPGTPPTQGTTPAQPPTQPPPTPAPSPSQPTTPAAPGPQGTSGQIQQPVPGTQGNRPITITGCLTPISGAATPGGFTLNNITGGESNSPTSYTLLGGDRALMGNYGNSRVEVSGTLASPVGTGNAVGTTGRGSTSAAAPPSSPASPAGTVSTGAAGTGGGAGTGVPPAGATGSAAAGTITTAPAGTPPPPPNFTVTSIRQVPGNCGGK